MRAVDVMDRVVSDLVAAIEAGATTWEMPWRTMASTGVATNAVTHNRYSGANALTLAMVAVARGYTSSRWATYKQWASVGAQVRRGEQGTQGIYWHVKPAQTTTDTGADGELTRDRVAWARAFSVFNVAQVDDAADVEATPDLTPLQRIERAEALFAAVPAAVGWGEGNPCYRPATDRVQMPAFDAFTSAEHAYGTLAHELAHWTGHPTRLNRTYGKRFGDDAYAAEELVAELSAAFTVPGRHRNRHPHRPRHLPLIVVPDAPRPPLHPVDRRRQGPSRNRLSRRLPRRAHQQQHRPSQQRQERRVTVTVRDRVGAHHCVEATAAAVVAAALRGGHAVTVRADDSPTWWRITPTIRGAAVAIEAINPSLFASTDPPPWAAPMTAIISRSRVDQRRRPIASGDTFSYRRPY